MDHFKFKSGNFKNFIEHSRSKIAKNLSELDSAVLELQSKNPMPSLVKRIIKYLDFLTQEDNIIWSKSYKGVYKGIVVKNCIFSDYKIILEKYSTEYMPHTEIYEENYKISFIKGILFAKKIEYISNFKENKSDIASLFGTIERKIYQEGN